MKDRIDPSRLTPAQMAHLLTKAGDRPITEEMIRADMAAGLPLNQDGTISIVTYAAWLTQHRGDEPCPSTSSNSTPPPASGC